MQKRVNLPKPIEETIKEIPAEILARLHRYYFGDPDEHCIYKPIESELREAAFWVVEGGGSTDEARSVFTAASFIEDLFAPVRTYGLNVPDPEPIPETA